MRATAERLRGGGYALAVTLLAVATLAIEAGFNLRARGDLRSVVVGLDYTLVGLVVVHLLAWLEGLGPRAFLRSRWLDLGLLAVAVLFLGLGLPRAAGGVVILRQLVVAVRLVSGLGWWRRLAERLRLKPLQILALSYAVTIGAGTFLLSFPAATADGRGADLMTGLFTATSAVCVTGLVVVDTGTFFAPFGQGVILVLIQVGGLGIMTLSAALVLLLRQRLALRHTGLMQDILEENSVKAFQDLVKRSVGVTLLFEAAGAAILLGRFAAAGLDLGAALWTSVFHSVSAFCNAGFSLYADSLSGFVGDPVVNGVIVVLIVAGGLGFTVIAELAGRDRRHRSYRRHLKSLSVHTRLTLVTTVWLLVAGTILFFYLEYDASLSGRPLSTRLLAALFQSTTFRTAGFNTVDFTALGPATLVFGMALMFIGGSSGSTAGGIKTTTFAVLALSVRSMLTGRSEVELYGRSIPKQVIYRSVAIAFISFALLVVFLILLVRTQPLPFLSLAFEAVSAFGTVGLTVGATPHLDTVGRLLVIVLMFIGRTGPLTFALAVGERPAAGRYSYPEERVMVG